MLKTTENQDLSYVGLQLSEILFLVDEAALKYGSEFALSQIRECAKNAIDRFQQPEGIIIFERAAES